MERAARADRTSKFGTVQGAGAAAAFPPGQISRLTEKYFLRRGAGFPRRSGEIFAYRKAGKLLCGQFIISEKFPDRPVGAGFHPKVI
jgi:hypothetical protein